MLALKKAFGTHSVDLWQLWLRCLTSPLSIRSTATFVEAHFCKMECCWTRCLQMRSCETHLTTLMTWMSCTPMLGSSAQRLYSASRGTGFKLKVFPIQYRFAGCWLFAGGKASLQEPAKCQ